MRAVRKKLRKVFFKKKQTSSNLISYHCLARYSTVPTMKTVHLELCIKVFTSSNRTLYALRS